MKYSSEKTPNIFDYATSELSQDAFLTWLIQWGDKKFQKSDDNLHACAILFIQELLGVKPNYEIAKIEAGRQWNNIDVWALINDKYFIIIEDKKGTKEHSDQLNRYSKIAEKHFENSTIEVKLIYFKMEEQGKYTDVKKAGFSLFGREKMLAILDNYFNSCKTGNYNDIIFDYYQNLKVLNNKINSFKTLPLANWSNYSWQGFYAELQKEIEGNWEYVSNAAGGFLGFWWNWNSGEINEKKFDFYLQLEQHKLVFKLYVNKANERREVRGLYRSILYKKAKKLNLEISQYGRIGAYMGVAKLNSEYRITDKNEILDFQATVNNMKQITEIINQIKMEL